MPSIYAVGALVLFAAVLATGVVLLGRWLWRIVQRLYWWLRARWRRVRKIISCWLQRIGRVLSPLLRRVPDAALYVAWVLLASTMAPWLFCVFYGHLAGHMPSGFLRDATANILVAAVAGLSTALFVSSLRGRRIKLSDQLLEELAGSVAPDGGIETNIVSFEPKDPRWLDGTMRHYNNIDEGSEESVEWLIALRQRGGPLRGEYSIKCLQEQIDAIEARINRIKARRQDKGDTHEAPALRWVCFVSFTGRYHALQRYDVFRYQITRKENAAYVEILNAENERKFWEAIDKNIKQSSPQTGTDAPQYYSDAVPGLECFWIENGTTRENALRIMTAAGKPRAMLVQRKNEGAPLGVVTIKTLTEPILFGPLKARGLQGSQSDTDRSGSTPPGL